jgi:proteic killer suppression protein
MLTSFGNQLTEDLFFDKKSRTTRRFPQYLRRIARRKLLYLHEATLLSDLKVPPGNRLEALRGDFKGYHSVRINDQWRLLFRWKNGSDENVQIVDYH